MTAVGRGPERPDARRVEYGDFQTPAPLARQVIALLARRGPPPAAVVEPTCGTGAFVAAALESFPSLRCLAAFDINPQYVAAARTRVGLHTTLVRCEVADFFRHDWAETVAALPDPILIVGNPPWVTSSGIGALGGANLPRKENAARLRGVDAITGKSNFDIAEWMVIRLIEACRGRGATIAMLLKTSVARRVLAHAWRCGLPIADAEIVSFDAAAAFGISAGSCVLVCRTPAHGAEQACSVRRLTDPDTRLGEIGWRDGRLVSSPAAYDRGRGLLAHPDRPSVRRWRSGVKHDCAEVMELRARPGGTLVTRRGAEVDIEDAYLYPLLKGSDLANGRIEATSRRLLVTQRGSGDETSTIAARAPRTWAYLCAHGDRLDARRSTIYRKRPRFAVFGVGPYTFAPWKVAISALHKRLEFAVVGPIDGRPVVFDDTCYHLSCETETEARDVAELLASAPARSLLESMIFWDAKRPITIDVLQQLSLEGVKGTVTFTAPATVAVRRNGPR